MDGPSPEMFHGVPKSFFDEAKMPAGPIRDVAGQPSRDLRPCSACDWACEHNEDTGPHRCPDGITIGYGPARGRSLDDEIMDIETAKIDRYAKFVTPAMNMILPGLDRVDRSQRALNKRFEDFDKAWRRNFALLVVAHAMVIVFFYCAFRNAFH